MVKYQGVEKEWKINIKKVSDRELKQNTEKGEIERGDKGR